MWDNRLILFLGYYAAMGVAGGGRNDVDPRFMSMFAVFNMSFPSDETVIHIYISILNGHTEIFNDSIKELTDSIIAATLNLYKVIIYNIC